MTRRLFGKQWIVPFCLHAMVGVCDKQPKELITLLELGIHQISLLYKPTDNNITKYKILCDA